MVINVIPTGSARPPVIFAIHGTKFWLNAPVPNVNTVSTVA